MCAEVIRVVMGSIIVNPLSRLPSCGMFEDIPFAVSDLAGKAEKTDLVTVSCHFYFG